MRSGFITQSVRNYSERYKYEISANIPQGLNCYLTTDDAPIIWRGPMLHGVVRQFFQDVLWDELDYLVIDMPPGTGDVALSLSQTVPVSGSIVVTTPQTVALADSRRAVAMYKKLEIPTLGVIENMSHFACPNCNHESDIFGKGGGERMAAELGLLPHCRALCGAGLHC